MPQQEDDLIFGVERDIVEKFLVLFRDQFRATTQATYFLERKEGEANIGGLANTRDALSHFVRALDPSSTRERRQEQLVTAEEHLRRAIVEPYSLALTYRLNRFNQLYEAYRRDVLPLVGKHPKFRDAPNITTVETVLTHIESLLNKGRDSKALNFQDTDWSAGVAGLIEGYAELYDLYIRVESYLSVRQAEKQANTQTWLAIWGLVMTLWGLVATVISLVLGIWTLFS
jgi:hypothetical protein